MSIEDGGPTEVILEDASDEEEICPVCEVDHWLRAIAVYKRGSCWVIYCGDCGRSFQERWNIFP